MRTETFRRESWHHWLAQQGGLYEHEDETDICRYLRCIFKGVIGICFVAALLLFCGGAMIWSIGDFIGWLVAGILYGFVEPQIALGVLILASMSALVGLLWGIARIAGLASRAASEAASDTFIGSARESIKQRMCFRVLIR